jgi:hypothetical protein
LLLRSTLETVERYLAGLVRSHEILVSDDSSTDGSARVAEEFARGTAAVRLVRGGAERGKGAALRRGFRAARGRYAAFLDADLEIPAENLGGLFAALDAGADIAIGSKTIGEEARRRPPLRRLFTLGYTTLVRLLLGSRLGDHQAGIKAFRMDRCRPIFDLVRADGWIWDTEVLVHAQRVGLVVRECPITTRAVRRPSRLSVFRDSIRMARDVLRLRLRGVKVR